MEISGLKEFSPEQQTDFNKPKDRIKIIKKELSFYFIVLIWD